jgi:hypothetical protein
MAGYLGMHTEVEGTVKALSFEGPNSHVSSILGDSSLRFVAKENAYSRIRVMFSGKIPAGFEALWQPFATHLSEVHKLESSDFPVRVSAHTSPHCFIVMCFE